MILSTGEMGEWRNGRRDGLKIHWPQGHESSTLSSPTTNELNETPPLVSLWSANTKEKMFFQFLKIPIPRKTKKQGTFFLWCSTLQVFGQ